MQTQYKEKHKGQKLPTVDKTVGGTDVDLMMGIRYNKYFPKLLFTLPGGLCIYRTVFISATVAKEFLVVRTKPGEQLMKQACL